MRVSVWENVCMSAVVYGAKKMALDLPVAGVVGSCHLPDVGAGK